jgi:hypothetical protein
MRETHEPAGAAMDQAIPRLAGDNTSGRAEDPMLLHKPFAQYANGLCKRKNSALLPPANRAVRPGTCLICMPIA